MVEWGRVGSSDEKWGRVGESGIDSGEVGRSGIDSEVGRSRVEWGRMG